MTNQTFAYERGSQAILINAAAANTGAFVAGSTPPAASAIVALPPTVSRGQLPFKLAVQVDFTGTVTSTEVDLLGSLDGVHFYVIGKATALVAGAIFAVDPAVVRFVAAAIPSGSFTSCTVSFSA